MIHDLSVVLQPGEKLFKLRIQQANPNFGRGVDGKSPIAKDGHSHSEAGEATNPVWWK